jgi:capsular polysaccharide biosynthesis protein
MGRNIVKFDFDASSIIQYIISKFKLLVIISITAAIVSGLASLLIKNKYKAEVVMFATTQSSVSQMLVDPNYQSYKSEYLGIGIDEDVDKLLQIVSSDDIKYELIEKYKLAEHYKVDLKSKGAYSKLISILDGRIKCSRTEFNSVSITFIDEDPEYAAKIANEISILADSVNIRMYREKATKGYKIIKNEYDSLRQNIILILDSLTQINKKGVLDYEYQTQELTKAYYNALVSGRPELIKNFENKMDILETFGANANVLIQELGYKQGFLNSLGQKLTIAKVAVTNTIPNKYIVSKAHVPDLKDSPKRSGIVILSAISAFFMALLAFIIIDNYKKFVK